MRVHEIAKELGLSSKDAVDRLHLLGVHVNNHMSALTEVEIERLRASAATAAKAVRGPAPQPETPAAAPVSGAVAGATPAPPGTAAVATDAEGRKIIALRGPVVVKELAELLGVRPNQLIAELMRMNVLASINEKVDLAHARKIIEKHGFVMELEKKPEVKPPQPKKAPKVSEKEGPEDIQARPPVVTFMGHVDHGKTSLLDRIRNTQVAKGEAGGITQHIGAYTVTHKDRAITFLDTPGHRAFTAMRARGANMTDIVVIVIAADDGIMPQTTEAIKHAQAANVTIMVAINKTDLPAANLDRVKQQLAAVGLTPEDWGGKTICCPVSALTGAGVDTLLDMILLQAEVMELKANPKRPAHGFVIEARLEPGMGPTSTLLIANGTLRPGDGILCGPYWGRVRALINDRGVKVKEATASMPVKMLGLSGVPEAGAEFKTCADDKIARAQAEVLLADLKQKQMFVPRRASLDTLFQQIKDSGRVELRVLIKADTQGSLEAIEHLLGEIKSDKVTLKPLMAAVGNITTNDVLLASASNAVVLGFHVATEEGVNKLAKQEGVEIRMHSIIYELADQVRDAMTGLLEPIIREKVMSHAEVRQVFTVSKSGVIAGCLVTDGTVTPRLKVRVKREGKSVYEGSIVSLRRFQNDASEVRETQECGIRIDNATAFAVGDIFEFYQVERVAQTL